MISPSVKAAMCGITTALSVVLMFLGGVMYIFTYAVPLILGILLFMFKKIFNTSSTAVVYVCTSILSLLFVPDKECVLMYVLFFGYYPLIKDKIDRIKFQVLKWIVKLVIFNASVFLVEILCVYVLNIDFFDGEAFSLLIIIVFTVGMNIMFLLYEFLLKYCLILYGKKFEKRINSIIRKK